MKLYIQDIKDMSDSREMLEARPHAFMTWFIYILLAIIIAAFAWSYFGELEEYVKAVGTVRPGDKISTIRNSVVGRVDTVALEEGIRVSKGDVLYTVEISTILLERDEKSNLLERLELENRNLQTFKKSVQDDTNLFDETNIDEAEYYTRYQKYATDRLVNAEQLKNSKIDLMQLKKEAELSKKMAESNLENTRNLLVNQELMLQSVTDNKNLLEGEDMAFAGRYENFTFTLEKLDTSYQQKMDVYERTKRLFEVGGVSRKELEETKRQMDMATLEIEGFKNEFTMNLHDGIKQSSLSIQELSNALERWQASYAAYSEKGQSTELLLEKMRLDTLVQLEDRIHTNRMTVDQLKGDLKSLEISIEEAIVTAPIEGYVHLHTEINKGDLLHSGMEIASIVPDTEGEFKVQIMVSNKDIASVKEGQKIKFHFLALPFREYGELEGAVKKIGTDARLDSQSGMSYYAVEASLDLKELVSYKGETAQIRLGMVCEAQVVTRSKKIIFWFLEKINLID